MARPVYVDLPDMPLAEAMQRGREDVGFFSHYFCRRELHAGQVKFARNANASINVLPTSNRWGKTSLLAIRHLHSCFYKLGAEERYVDPVHGAVDLEKYLRTRYYTVHTAGLWETAKLVWEDALKILKESERLQPFVTDTPRTLPPSIKFTNGSVWLFRTLGDNGENVDGHSFYLVSIDEAGWITNLETIINNVIRVRVADVQGRIDLVGTMKIGLSRDFYRYANRGSVATGVKIAFDHRDGRDYLKEFDLAG